MNSLFLLMPVFCSSVTSGCSTPGCSCDDGVLNCAPDSLFVSPNNLQLTGDGQVVEIPAQAIKQVGTVLIFYLLVHI